MKTSTFHFTNHAFSREKREVKFFYDVTRGAEKIHFTEVLQLPNISIRKNLPQNILDSILRDLHLAIGLSYYKMFLSQKVVFPYKLTKEQAAFWSRIYREGHGELLFQNKVSPNRIAKFSSDAKALPGTEYIWQKDRSLVGIGGGKDSIVGAELLKSIGQEIGVFHVSNGHPSKIVENVTKLVGVKLPVDFVRKLDPKIFDKNVAEFQGHIPVSVIFAFLGVFGALLYDYRYVVVSNEKSSNFGNIEYKGLQVNHQWSKSEAVEKAVQKYVKDFITPSVVYYSQIRAFDEIRVAKIFSKYEKYFYTFSSCNRAYKMFDASPVLWCGECAKCSFVFLMLAPFIPKQKLLNIFRKNLLNDPGLIQMYKDLLGYGGLKPFDCVGTFEESRVAFSLIKKKFAHDIVVKKLKHFVKDSSAENRKVFSFQDAPTVPARFKFLGATSALIVGYGKEGRASHEYLKKFYPGLRVGIADLKQGKNYLNKQENFEIAIKTPVVPHEKMKIPYTTATNLFFSHVQNKIIGVTGTKGKSTTASLIAHFLKVAGKKVELHGNIGSPMLARVARLIPQDTTFVLELSSYQLEDITSSPQIAVVTTLFPEHMDHHGSLEKYYAAKKNIINFQTASDYFVYNSKNRLLRSWSKTSSAKTIQESKNLPLDLGKTELQGNHNVSNAKLAVAVAELLELPKPVVVSGLKTFRALPHRLQNIGTFKGITFYDDAISTTPESTLAALSTLKNVSTIFLGGEDRGYSFKVLEEKILKSKIRNIVLFPETGKKMFTQKSKLNILRTTQMQDAVRFAYEHAKPESVVLLSCASPSYTLWKNFEEKGDEFQKWVKKLAK
jgi:UDP-N-acetylmuramoylalanine--D-glutamate ligase